MEKQELITILETTVKALEKQIPKSPTYVEDDLSEHKAYCFSCNSLLDEDLDSCRPYNYCPRCGQRIDWKH